MDLREEVLDRLSRSLLMRRSCCEEGDLLISFVLVVVVGDGQRGAETPKGRAPSGTAPGLVV